jgi:asparagine synthase (glutamine-hydrolysing)
MTVQFGKCTFDGKPIDRAELDQVRPLLSPYGPDGEGSFYGENAAILVRVVHTTRESRNEVQPFVSVRGFTITWDGRLDNREELIGSLRGVSDSSTDVSIVAAAYEQWSTLCFAKLLGDWALSIWEPKSHCLTLARDFVGTRPLYYLLEKDSATWCTILDPLVLFSGRTLALEEEYLAGWLTFFPAPHLTPYIGIDSVPPSSYVCLAKGKRRIIKYWDFDPSKRIRHHSDAEYEDHFRAAFRESVRRRLRSETAILAELSGGMDSSSVVCMADTILAQGDAEASRLDTISYYDDSEPNWNERPYFTLVEQMRGRAGCHVDLGPHEQFIAVNGHQFAPTPSSCDRGNRADQQRAICISSNQNRVLLSGIGGDEMTGGVPTPIPELADLLASGRFGTFAHQLMIWALSKRKPWTHLFFDVVGRLFPPALIGSSNHLSPPQWLKPHFINRHRSALVGYENRLRLFGASPSFQENVSTLDALRRQLACDVLPIAPPYEKRYPFLDRDLLEFIFAIPREQVVRPGQRRSLMRRALIGIVPDEILNRKRKAYLARSPIASLLTQWSHFARPDEPMVCDSLGILDSGAFKEMLRQAHDGREVPVVTLLRTLGMEVWIRGLLNPEGHRRATIRGLSQGEGAEISQLRTTN